MIRDLSFKELQKLLKLKITPESSEDLVLVAGDFNVFRYNTVNEQIRILYSQDPQWANYFDLIDDEYECLLNTLQADGKFDTVNLWDRDNKGKRCITTGECEISEQGIYTPLETVLTQGVDQISGNCLDFVFEVQQKNSKFKTSNTRVEKMLV